MRSGSATSAPDATIRAIQTAIQRGKSTAARSRETDTIVTTAGSRLRLGPAEIRLEDGSNLTVDRLLPADLPLGYHDFQKRGGRAGRLIVAPAVCHLPRGFRTWGWVIQLYAARSRRSWGIGDLADLRWLGRWARGQGAGIALINPLSARQPADSSTAEPIFPIEPPISQPSLLADRRSSWRPSAPRTRGTGENRPRAQRRSRDRTRRDIPPEDGRARAHLEKRPRPRRPRFRPLLPRPARSRTVRDLFSVRRTIRHRLATVARASSAIHPPRQSIARGGSVRRALESSFTSGCSIRSIGNWSAPRRRCRSCRTSRSVSTWTAPMPGHFRTCSLTASAWEPLRTNSTPAARTGVCRHSYRTSSAPPDTTPSSRRFARACVTPAGCASITPWVSSGFSGFRWPPSRKTAHTCEAIRPICCRSSRSKVSAPRPLSSARILEPSRTKRASSLAAKQILSYRLLWFEKTPPSHFPERALAAVTTHDLPTIAGLWSGSDLKAQQRLGLSPNEAGTAGIRSRVRRLTRSADKTSAAVVVARVHEALSHAPSRILTATLDDAMAVEERPNIPATTHEWPNWRIALPKPIESLKASRLARRIAKALRR